MALQDPSILELRGVSRQPSRSEGAPEGSLHEITFALPPRVCVWLAGPAGGGKELLFRILSLAERPDSGELLLEGCSQRDLASGDCSELRARKFGFLATAPFLIPTFSAIENIAVPLMKVSHPQLEQAQDRIAELLRFVDLHEKAELPARELSPLDQVRLVLARALANAPRVLFVEDFSALLQGADLLSLTHLLRQACATFGVAVVALEGACNLAVAGDRRLDLVAGRLENIHPSTPSLRS